MRTTKKFLLLLFLTVCTSCMTRLKVNVQVADRDKVLEEVDRGLEKQLPRMIKSFDYQWDRGESVSAEAVKILEKLGNNEEAVSTLDVRLNEIENNKKIFDSLFKENKFSESYNQLLKVENDFVEYYDEIKKFLTGFDEKFLKVAKIDKSEIENLNFKISNSTHELKKLKTQSTRLRYNLLGDPLTSFITYDNRPKKEEIWKSLFNETKVSTFFGNADIAILLRKNIDSTSKVRSGDYNNNFTIKGVRLDAEDAIQASFTSLSQSINLFAAMQLPELNLTSANSSTDFPTLPATLRDGLGSNAQNESKIKRKERFLSEIKKLMIQKIIYSNVESKNLKEETEKKEFLEGINDIKAYWTTVKTELEAIKTE